MKRHVCHLVGVIVLIGIFTSNLKATTKISYEELDALESSQEARAIFAEKLASFYQRLNDDIPNLKPSESEWLQKETERTSHFWTTDRMELEKSREWHIAHAKEQLDRLKEDARYVAATIREYMAMSTPKTKPAYVNLEMKQWIHFSNDQLEVNPFYHYLELLLHYNLHTSEAMPLMGGMIIEGKVIDTPKQIAGTINKWIIERYLSGLTRQIASNISTNTIKTAEISSVTNSTFPK